MKKIITVRNIFFFILAAISLPISATVLAMYVTGLLLLKIAELFIDLALKILKMKKSKWKKEKPVKMQVECSCGCGGFLTTSDLIYSDTKKLSCMVRDGRKTNPNT